MMKTQIKAEIVADSLSPQGDRLTSLLITFPRIILAEVNTHRMISKNTSSSRAIPFKKMVESVQNDPFIPIAWQKHHSGMQGTEYFTDDNMMSSLCQENWLRARDNAVHVAKSMSNSGVTKQLCNRLLEPFMWTTMLITGSKEGWNNFFKLRCPQYYYDLEDKYFKSKKEWLDYYRTNCIGDPNSNFELDEMDWFNINKGQAEIHIMDLAEKIYDVMNESTPNQLEAGEWHIPFEDKIYLDNKGTNIYDEAYGTTLRMFLEALPNINSIKGIPIEIKISTAMAARTSYTVVGDEKEIDYERMIGLHDRLLAQDPPHSSPMEHCARAMSDEEYYKFVKGEIVEINPDGKGNCEGLDWKKAAGWCRNFKGFIQYRHIIENKKYE